MTIQDVGDHLKWLELLNKTIGRNIEIVSNSTIEYGLCDTEFGLTRVCVCAYIDLQVYIYVYVNKKFIASIWIDGSVETNYDKTAYKLGTEFHNDTRGVLILIDTLKRMNHDTPRSCVNAIQESERLYKEKFRGMVAGSKFGF